MSKSSTQVITGGTVEFVLPVAKHDAPGLVSRVDAQAEEEFGLVPPLTVHSASPEILADI